MVGQGNWLKGTNQIWNCSVGSMHGSMATGNWLDGPVWISIQSWKKNSMNGWYFTHGTAERGFQRLQSQVSLRTSDGTVRVSKSYIRQKEKRTKLRAVDLRCYLLNEIIILYNHASPHSILQKRKTLWSNLTILSSFSMTETWNDMKTSKAWMHVNFWTKSKG